MVRKRTLLSCLLLILIFLLVLSGCWRSSESAPAGPFDQEGFTAQGEALESKPVTLKFMHIWPESISAQQFKLVSQIIDQYEKDNPNVTIRQEAVENEQYKNKLKVLSAFNELPDIGITWAAGFMEPYVKAGLFARLNDVLNGPELKKRFVPGTVEAYTVDGTTYALPIELNITPVYYNKDIFAKYHLQIPQTYTELKKVIQILADNDVEAIALGNKDRWTGSLWYMYLADRIVGSETLAKAISGTGSFKDSGLIQAAAEIQNLVNMNAFNKGFNGLSNDEGKSEFMNGKAAMFLAGTWEIPNFTSNPDVTQEFKDKVGFFRFPTVEGGKGDINSWVGGPGAGLFVAENSRVKEEAEKFVAYFVSKWGEQSVTEAGVIPATKVDTASMALPQMYVDLLKELNNASNITLFADVQMKPDAAQIHLNMIQALFGEAVTPAIFAEKHQEAAQRGK